MKILVINPGATSTKIAVFEDKNKVIQETLQHSVEELDKYKSVMDQKDMRAKAILDFLSKNSLKIEDLDAIAARGGILPPVEGGTYLVDENMVDYLVNRTKVQHASNLAAVIGYELASGASKNIPVYITDPVSVDEMIPEARLSGIKDIERKSLSHISNMRAVGIRIAEELGKKFNELNMVIAHLGSGISVAPFEKGRMIDVNNANDEGPFSVERTGELPVGDVVKLAYSGEYTKDQMKRMFIGKGGLVAYLGTNDLREAFRMAESDPKALEVIEAMAYQIAQEIGAMCVSLKGKVDAIVLTGGMAYSERFVEMIRSYIYKFGPIFVVPGEMEMEALAYGALRVLIGEELPKVWRDER
ncbi:MAG: butyrate kinase [Fervidobacterium sp.]|uniref:Probable butyrate kinase n=1 Tax=Fervidobacterium gondwanense DSM 13020 TaxID=1121883 RepID=A0A1M7SE87_FERGO|nr:butyrate kinase [Fervidobacterium gondwanense]UXF01176.1 butyrate kinase [Fervidobacterium riparium]SHN56795.1 butyrate kinase [Fervidobacterium gondwanense DSM 13020]